MSPVIQEAISDPRGTSGAGEPCGCASGPSAVASGGANSSSPASGRGQAYWRSVEELLGTPEFRQRMHDEFPAGAIDLMDGDDRRHFLKIMGASMALAGLSLAGCRRWPRETIAPFAHRPEDRTPGAPEFYATCMELGGVANALLVTSYDGRPTKVEGNPQHPVSRGATDLFAQARVLDLYDPDRSQHVLRQGERSDWNAFTSWAGPHLAGLRRQGGRGLAVLSEPSHSPSLLDMKARLLAACPQASWHEYEPLHEDAARAGSVLAFGAPHRVHHHLAAAKVIVALDADFLSDHRSGVRLNREFADGRRLRSPDDSMSRLYSFEGVLSLTGANADHRFAVRSSDISLVAADLARRLAKSGPSGQTPAGCDGEAYEKFISAVVDDLAAHRGESVLIAGARQPAEVHALVHQLNAELGNAGKTVTYSPQPEGPGRVESLTALAAAVNSGTVDTLVILGGNPAFDAPVDVQFEAALKKAANTIHLGFYADETGAACGWHVPAAHAFETWGDGRSEDGTICLAQPIIEPLFGGKSPIEMLALLAGDSATSGYEIVQRTFGDYTGSAGAGQFESLWRHTLHEGFLAGSGWATGAAAIRGDALPAVDARAKDAASPAGAMEVVFTPDHRILDGRFANNAWLQELPDPMTRLTWDNAAVISLAAADRLGVKTGDMVRIKSGERTVDAAVAVLPGVHDHCVGLALGSGRRFAGRICVGAGFDFNALRISTAMGFAREATVVKIDGTYVLAMTQDHHAIDTQSVGGKGVQERLPTIFREASLGEYQQHPDFAAHRTHVVHRLSLWEENHAFHDAVNGREGRYAWAMSIDLNACTGCGACVVACQAENNIPVVGKDQVKRGREMHWIRVDRYFKFGRTGGGPDPSKLESVALQPVTCMHCENAPCEQVCPVAATVHDEDGLNVMVYNRCVGTRYCSNNCPYKVRRFNFFDNQVRTPVREGGLLHVQPEYYPHPQSGTEALQRLQFNPEVTVRSRGVMEKCTFCVQRLAAAKITAKNNWVKSRGLDPDAALAERVAIPDGSVTTACAQACPAQAIVFGDLNDSASRVATIFQKNQRSYEMLEELNTKPRTRYLAKVRNTHEGLASVAPDHGPHHDDHAHAEAGHS
jgi:molybdopterin-containing oxidoreductase family iron-sulfur binding subunit